MLAIPTLTKLQELNLPGMAPPSPSSWNGPTTPSLTFEERLGLLVDRECPGARQPSLGAQPQGGQAAQQACLEELDFELPRGLDRRPARSLAEAGWVAAKRNILISGPTGVGKTFLACALAQGAHSPGSSRPLSARPASAGRPRSGRAPTGACHAF